MNRNVIKIENFISFHLFFNKKIEKAFTSLIHGVLYEKSSFM